ncbi:MAG TPA: DUF4340 domain-containing protein [Chitinophagaceae bacterium]|nr:DUF4340 domain-containing protein [Chitinophagaceae bacterium]HNF71931.1 DUF4340 domain-containing protein [Chitinophagaceae bacterium]
MKKNGLYALAFLLLALGTYYLVFKPKEDSFDSKEVHFTVKDTASIQKIFLSNLNGESLVFSRSNGAWVINDSIEAVQYLVNDLLTALHDQQAVQPVRVSNHDAVIRELSANSTKVEIYTGEGKTHTFYVGQHASPDNLTYMLNEGAKRPYIVKLPLQNTFVGIRYNTRLRNWRSKLILRAAASNIEWIDVAFADSVHYSFHLEQPASGQATVTGKGSIPGQLNLQRVTEYLGLWDSLYCLGYEDRNKLKDTLITKAHKIADVQMKARGRSVQTLSLFFKPVSKGTKGMIEVGNEKYDFDVMTGLLNNREMIVVTRKYANRILRSYPDFFSRP